MTRKVLVADDDGASRSGLAALLSGWGYAVEQAADGAEAVAAELAKSYKIANTRLKTAGVGFLAPLGSNATDDGRALNRRVELVAP